MSPDDAEEVAVLRQLLGLPIMSPDDAVAAAEKHILEVIAEPGCSFWLRDAARAAITRDPVDVLDDAEILLMILQRWVGAVIDASTARAVKPPLPFADQPVQL